MKLLFPLLALFLFSCSPKPLVKNDNNSKPFSQQDVVEQFIKLIKKNDKKKLSSQILYPLNRKHPLSEVVDKKDFLKRYDEIFDTEFRNMIINSDQEKDWEQVGSRGIMFKRGKLWLDLSGRLFAVNYQSKVEKDKAAAIMLKQNLDLHESVRVFEKPILEMETKTYLIRIDNLGDYNYRYVGWANNGKPTTSKPDIILTNGVRHPEGSGGNHRFEFKNGENRYEVFVIKLGERDSPPAVLNIYTGYKKIFSEDASTFKD